MSKEENKDRKKNQTNKSLFHQIDSIIDKLIEAQNMQDNLQELEASHLIAEIIKNCQEVADSLKLLSKNTEELSLETSKNNPGLNGSNHKIKPRKTLIIKERTRLNRASIKFKKSDLDPDKY